MQLAARRFVIRFALLTLAFYVIVAAGSYAFDRLTDWRSRQNPRERLLWDLRTDEADLIVLGDSVFISAYVDSASDSLGNLLAKRTGKAVFDGAMDGADSA